MTEIQVIKLKTIYTLRDFAPINDKWIKCDKSNNNNISEDAAKKIFTICEGYDVVDLTNIRKNGVNADTKKLLLDALENVIISKEVYDKILTKVVTDSGCPDLFFYKPTTNNFFFAEIKTANYGVSFTVEQLDWQIFLNSLCKSVIIITIPLYDIDFKSVLYENMDFYVSKEYKK